jgi:hypothetical protein
MLIIRSIYRGETDIILKLYKLFGVADIIRVFHIWVAYPETGDIIVSFSSGEKEAQFTQVHHFNFYELLESNPPP